MYVNTIKDEVKIEDVTYEYCELRYGGKGPGPRGIRIWIKGQIGPQEYKFQPNPHTADPKWYSKNSEKFYKSAATQIATIQHGTGTWPVFGTVIEIHKTDYELTQP